MGYQRVYAGVGGWNKATSVRVSVGRRSVESSGDGDSDERGAGESVLLQILG